jgi:hypothetical protein
MHEIFLTILKIVCIVVVLALNLVQVNMLMNETRGEKEA